VFFPDTRETRGPAGERVRPLASTVMMPTAQQLPGQPPSPRKPAGAFAGCSPQRAASSSSPAQGASPLPGELLPRPVFPYRRLRIQGGQGRGSLGYRFIITSFVNG
jgi:hypothetical protein